MSIVSCKGSHVIYRARTISVVTGRRSNAIELREQEDVECRIFSTKCRYFLCRYQLIPSQRTAICLHASNNIDNRMFLHGAIYTRRRSSSCVTPSSECTSIGLKRPLDNRLFYRVVCPLVGHVLGADDFHVKCSTDSTASQYPQSSTAALKYRSHRFTTSGSAMKTLSSHPYLLWDCR